MRKLQFMALIAVSWAISGCIAFDTYPFQPEQQTGEQMMQQVGFEGAQFAKLNSIGCIYCSDIDKIKSADFTTIDNLIKERRCFVIPTDVEIYIKERVRDDIVSAKLKDSKELFFTVKSNLFTR